MQRRELPFRRDYLRALIIAAITILSVPTFGQDTVKYRIGMRDPISIGLSAGSPTAICVNVRVIPARTFRFAVGGYYGAGVARWGMGEGHAISAQLDLSLADDGVNNAMLLSPEFEYATLVGVSPPKRGWIDFSPYETVNSIGLLCGIGWVHEYRSWSLELMLAPGEAYALGGRDSNGSSASGELSFQFRMILGGRF